MSENPEPRTQNRVAQTEAGLTLDDRALVERLDPQGLLGRIEALPEQCEEAWHSASGFEVPPSYADGDPRSVRQVVVLGMGGSAIGGDILRALAAPRGRRPVTVVRGYELPASVDAATLVIACSHSGNTEETLAAFEQALAVGAQTLVIATGGRLLALAQERGLPALTYQYEGEPRSALGHQLMALLAVGERIGLLEPPSGRPRTGARLGPSGRQEVAVAEAVTLMRRQRGEIGFALPFQRNPAKQLAARLHERLPVVIGAGVLAEAAHRWKTQLNENSKSWALHEELPELDHNAIAGLGLPQELIERLHAVFLWHPALHQRVLLRYEATAEALDRAGVSHERLEVGGRSPLAQVLSAVYLGDFVSYYLALLNGVEPSPVAEIEQLKARLAGGPS